MNLGNTSTHIHHLKAMPKVNLHLQTTKGLNVKAKLWHLFSLVLD